MLGVLTRYVNVKSERYSEMAKQSKETAHPTALCRACHRLAVRHCRRDEKTGGWPAARSMPRRPRTKPSSLMDGAQGRNRTVTPLSGPGILSPAALFT